MLGVIPHKGGGLTGMENMAQVSAGSKMMERPLHAAGTLTLIWVISVTENKKRGDTIQTRVIHLTSQYLLSIY